MRVASAQILVTGGIISLSVHTNMEYFSHKAKTEKSFYLSDYNKLHNNVVI